MASRYWLSGPRVLHGLVRPGISFSASDIAGIFAAMPKAAGAALLAVATRPDGAVTIVRDKTTEATALDSVYGAKMQIVFVFKSVAAAEAVLEGALVTIARKASTEAQGWFHGVSAGQVAAAIKSEAQALSHEVDVVHPGAGDAPKAKDLRAWIAIVVFGIIAAIALHAAAHMYMGGHMKS